MVLGSRWTRLSRRIRGWERWWWWRRRRGRLEKERREGKEREKEKVCFFLVGKKNENKKEI